MTLSEMVAQVGADTGYLDTDDVAYTRTAIRQRDELLYRMGLWKDSLVQVTVPVDPTTNNDHAEGIIYLPEVIERVVSVRTADAYQRVGALETFYRMDFDKFSQTGSPMEFAKLAPAWFSWQDTGASPQLIFAAISVSPSTETNNVMVTYLDSDGNRQTVAAELTDGDLVIVDSPVVVESLFKAVTSGDIQVSSSAPEFPYGFESVAASATRSPKHQRIRLFPIPTSAGGIRVLGKANYRPMTVDQEEPQITGSHLALMAFAKHLLRKRGGEIGASADDLQEALGLVETLKKEEMQQEAYNARIIPDSGYGDMFFGPGRDGFFVG